MKNIIFILCSLILSCFTNFCHAGVAIVGGEATGNMLGIRISVPAEYKFLPIEYMKHQEGKTGFDREIKSISIILDSNSFAPIASSESKEKNMGRLEDGSRIMIAIDSGNYGGREKYVNFLISNIFSTKYGSGYIDDNEQIVRGLRHKVSMAKFGNLINGDVADDSDIFFDVDKNKSLIACKVHRQHGFPYEIWQECSQNFFVPEINSEIKVFYPIKLISKWETIFEKITKIVISFRAE